MALETTWHLADNGHGWLLSLRQSWNPDTVTLDRRPLVIIPGYGMNAFIFGWHPNGPSMIEFLADRGFEVWTVDLRAQGRSVCKGGSKDYHIEDAALTDLEVTFRTVLEHTRTQREDLVGIGCSLGGTYLYAHAALVDGNPLGAIVGMGAPLRWDTAHPLIRLAFSQPWLVKRVPMAGIPRLARVVLPVLARFPSLLHIYMHPEMIDMSHVEMLAQAVEDPNPTLNADMAWWFRRRDLLIRGKMVSEELHRVQVPFFCMYGNGDGIVPPESALSAYRCIGTPESHKATFLVGDERRKFAHADMFIADPAQEMVFTPLATWLAQLHD